MVEEHYEVWCIERPSNCVRVNDWSSANVESWLNEGKVIERCPHAHRSRPRKRRLPA